MTCAGCARPTATEWCCNHCFHWVSWAHFQGTRPRHNLNCHLRHTFRKATR